MTETSPGTRVADLDVGAVITPFVRSADLHAWNRFAAVNDEFVDIHMDDEAGRAAGYSGAIGMGNLVWSWLHAALELWLDGRGDVEHVECRFTAPALKGSTVTCSGTVTDRHVREDATVLELDLWADDSEGNRLARSTGRVRLQADGAAAAPDGTAG